MRRDKFTATTEILWRKRDDVAALSMEERAGAVPCLDRLLLGLICIGIQGVCVCVCVCSVYSKIEYRAYIYIAKYIY